MQKTIIVFESSHHKNTEKIARVIAQSLKADLFRPEQVCFSKLSCYDTIGIGSGIYFGKPHLKIQEFLDHMNPLRGTKGFLFITSGIQKQRYLQYVKIKMELKGIQVLEYFCCKGYDTYGPLKLIGGINKGHPNEVDLLQAELFANKLLDRL